MSAELQRFQLCLSNFLQSNILKIYIFYDRDADDACHDLDGKDLQGGRVRVELAKDPRRGGSGGGGGGGGGGRFGDRDRGGRRGNPPGPRTKYRIIVENVSSKTSWQVNQSRF